MLKNYLKVAIRNILKHKGYSFINIIGLSLGMVCCIIIFLWIQDELSYEGFHQRADNLYRIIVHAPMGTVADSPYAMPPILKNKYPEIEKATRFYKANYAVKYEENTFYEEGGFVDADFFHMFTFPFIKGDPNKAFPDKNTIVITRSLARKYFGFEDPIGKILTINNRTKVAVTGVMDDIPSNTHFKFSFLANIKIFKQEVLDSWVWDITGYLLLNPNAPVKELQQKIAGTILEYDKVNQIKTEVDLQPITQIHLYALEGTGPIIYVYLFAAIALIVLLIACINFINLSTAKSSHRAKEIGVQKVMGAQRKDIIKQFLGESIVMSFIAMLLAIVMVWLFLPKFNQLASKQLSIDLVGNLSNLMVLILLTIITGVVANSYTAIYMSSFKPIDVLKSSYTPGSRNYNLRRVLVISQFSLAVILMICTFVVFKQLSFIRNRDLGFNKDNVLTVTMNSQIQNNYDTIKNELLRNPQIVHVTAASAMPLSVSDFNLVTWEGRRSDDFVNFSWMQVGFDFFETFDIKILQGRTFSEEFSMDNLKFIVNESALKFMGMTEPIGKQFSLETFKGQLIGIAKDFHSTPLKNDIKKMLFVMTPPGHHKYMFIKLRAESINTTVQFISEKLKQLAPGYPIDYWFLDDTFQQQYKSDRKVGTLFIYFTILAIFISCLGLYGLVSYSAEQKKKEIGIRKVHGATIANIIELISKEFIQLVLISTAISFPIAYYLMNRWLKNYAYHTNLAIWEFLLSGILAILITILTVWYQAYKAAVANPIDSIKYE